MTVKTKLKSDDWFKSYGPMKYPLGSPLGAAILCILPSIHLWEGLEAGSSEIVVPSREYRRMRAQFEASLNACFHFDSYKFWNG